MSFLFDQSLKRKKFLSVRGKALPTPIFFPSISSIKTGTSPFEYSQILVELGFSQLLVSVYDVAAAANREEFISSLEKNRSSDGPVVLLDSGNCESFWLRDMSWTPSRFNELLGFNVCDLVFCFDNQHLRSG